MMHLLVIKEQLKRYYQKTSVYVEPVLKFAIACIVFMVINLKLGFNPKVSSLPVLLGLSAVCAFMPSVILVLLAMLVTVFQIYTVSKVLAIFAAIILIIMYCLFSKFTPDFGYVVLGVPILFFLKIPYCIPVLMGLIATPVSIVPIACGVALYYLIGVICELTNYTIGISIEDIINLFKTVVDQWAVNPDMFFMIGVFCAVVLITYIIRKQEFDYSFEVAIVAGGVVNLLGFLIGNIGYNIKINILEMILGTLGSMIIVYIIWFFRLTLDHTAIERVQFEDDDYYYYVKAVPKMKITAPEKSVRKINIKKQSENEETEKEE